MRMNFVSLFVSTVYLCIVSCKEVCMQFKLAGCYLKVSLRHLQNPICAAHTELTKCIGTEAEDCGLWSDPFVGAIQSIYTDTCTGGTDMNRLFKEHNACVTRAAASVNRECASSVRDRVKDLGVPTNTREYKVGVLRVGCKYGHERDRCIQKSINRTCGSEATEFQRRLSNPAKDLSNQACKAIEGENDDIQTNLLQSILVSRRGRENQPTLLRNHPFADAIVPHVYNLYLASTVPPYFDEV